MAKDSDKDYVINIDHVKKAFGKNTVLKDVNLKVRDGESVCTLGKSGTGKSVILQCIAGLLKPDSGKILVYGENVPMLDDDELQEIRKKIGFLFQSGALYDSMSVRENLEFPLRRLTDLTIPEINDKVKEALEQVGLANAIDKMPSELSGGMKKRIGLARTLITDPKIMLYDEPTTGLDPATSREISKLILEVQKKYKTTSIIVTHDMECARMVSDRMVVLKDGEYIVEGTFEELQKNDDPFVKSFFEGLNF
jgi:phospholipid/cholesterol/gamma-HCH transport system ATP-binding protein